mmetsp:Transcript_4699/g.8989  ORF Transcript_4699/g.8989 Transcript_4699/m.8989 type:complete len:223 (+) Transcript_4699:84-752(+)
MLSFAPRALLLALLSLIASAASVEMTCCNDAVYTLSINLAQTCEESTIGGLGIADTSCFNTFLQPVSGTDSVLLESVRRVDIYEHDLNFGLLARQTITGPIIDGVPGPLADGEVLEYRSVVGNDGDATPNSLQVVVTAESSEGTLVLNMWQVTYQDSCILPAFPEESKIGWTTVTLTCNGFYEPEGGGETEDLDVVGDNGGTGKGSKMNKRKRRLQQGPRRV